MLSKNQIKHIARLKQKKFRLQEKLFVAEGVKTIQELLDSRMELQQLYTTESFNLDAKDELLITENDLKKISFLKTPQKALAIFKIREAQPVVSNQLILALDDVRDPGNLGTIIRLCDWFGITDLVCSNETVDCYNPKVVQATMGSIARVNITYLDLPHFIENQNMPVFGAFMDGENVYQTKLPDKGILIMGNEANGISEEISQLISHKIAIPRFGERQVTESLNVAMATSILLSEFKRNSVL